MLCGLPHDASDALLQRRRGARDPQGYDPPDETRRIAALVRDRPLFRGLFFDRLLPRSWFGACRFFQVLIVTPLAVVIGGDGELHALPRSVPMVSRGTAALHWWWPLLTLHCHWTLLPAESKPRRLRACTFEASVSLSFSASLVCR